MRGRPADRRGGAHALYRGGRRRALHQSAHRARPDARRHRARRGPGARRAVRGRRRGPAARRHADGLRAAARRRPAELPLRDRRGALADESVRHQGRRRRRHHAGARRGGECAGRRAGRIRGARYRAAGHRAGDMASHPPDGEVRLTLLLYACPIAAVKARPGEIGFAGSGSGSTPHLAGELFNAMAGVQMVHIPYRGSGPAMIGLLSGDAPVMFIPAINAGPHIAAGKVRALGVTSRERLAAFPDLPTLAESGLARYESSHWYSVLSPAGTPPEVLDFLNAHAVKIMRAPEMKARMTHDGLVAIGGSREEFAAHIRAEGEKWARVIRASGASVD